MGKPEVITNWLFSKQRTHELTIVFLWLLTLKQTCLLVNQSMCSPGEYSGFQVTGMIEWGQKSNPQKLSVPKCNPPKNPMPNSRAIKFPESMKWYNYNESSDCFEYPKNSLLKSSCLEKYLPKFSYPQNIPNSKFQTQKNSSVIPVTWNLVHPPWGICYLINAKFASMRWMQ